MPPELFNSSTSASWGKNSHLKVFKNKSEVITTDPLDEYNLFNTVSTPNNATITYSSSSSSDFRDELNAKIEAYKENFEEAIRWYDDRIEEMNEKITILEAIISQLSDEIKKNNGGN